MSEKSAQTQGDGRDTRWEDHRAERRDRILSAAVDAIEHDGGSIGVAGIADKAEVPRSVVYRLFKDRGDLDEQIRSRIIDDLMADLAPTLDPKGSIESAIRTSVQAYVGWVAEHPNLHQFLGAGSPSRRESRSVVARGTRTAIALEVTRLLDAQLGLLLGNGTAPVGTPDNVAFGMIGLIDGAVNRWVAHPESRSTSAELVDFLTDALCAVVLSTAERLGTPLSADQPLRRPRKARTPRPRRSPNTP